MRFSCFFFATAPPLRRKSCRCCLTATQKREDGSCEPASNTDALHTRSAQLATRGSLKQHLHRPRDMRKSFEIRRGQRKRTRTKKETYQTCFAILRHSFCFSSDFCMCAKSRPCSAHMSDLRLTRRLPLPHGMRFSPPTFARSWEAVRITSSSGRSRERSEQELQ